MLRFFLLTALYVLATWYSDAFIAGNSKVTLFWPAAGLAYGAMLRYGWRSSLFIPVGVIISHATFTSVPWSFVPFSAVSNLVGSLAGGYVAHALSNGVKPQLSVASGMAMVRGAIVMVLVSAVIGTAGLVFSGMLPTSAVWPALMKWSMGDLLGIACITPTMLVLTRRPGRHPELLTASDYSAPSEKVTWLVMLLVAFGLVYWGGMLSSAYALGMVALPLTLLLWSATRFEPIWTTVGTSIAVFFLTSLTGLGLAGFQVPTVSFDTAALLALMTMVASIPLMLLASVTQQRVDARKALRQTTAAAESQRLQLERQVAERTLELEEANQKLETASQTDLLTGLRNRRYLTNQIPADLSFYDREHLRTGQTDHALLFALVDIDHFKRINDTYGHRAGDAVLQQFAQVMSKLVRVGDYVVRWGGEEFLLIFRPMPRDFVPVLGDRIRRCVAEHAFEV
ncbi:MAG: diguanylate cyclase, partial [Pseudomonadota bacterium]